MSYEREDRLAQQRERDRLLYKRMMCSHPTLRVVHDREAVCTECEYPFELVPSKKEPSPGQGSFGL